MSQNNRRFDLSDRLIHFFRDLDLEQSDAPPTPEDWGYASVVEDWKMPAFFLLRHALRQGRLWATWSVRGGRRTIYGPRPAVCFTEMPIAAYIEASELRAAAGEKMGTCALVLPKQAAFAAGARPVIYALSSNAWASGTDGERSFASSALPQQEQYRYVAYDPTKTTLDWTHEREWRWPLDTEPYKEDEDGIPPSSCDEIPGLDLDHPSMRGIGLIVGNQRQADKMIHDILTKVDRNDVAEGHYSFIIVRAHIDNLEALRGHAEMDEAIYDGLIDLEQYFSIKKAAAQKQHDELQALATTIGAKTASPGPEHFDEPGGCWLWLKDNRHPLVRALIRLEAITITDNGRYLVDLPELDVRRPLRQREEMVQALVKELRTKFGISASYFSVLGSHNPNHIPTYSDDLVSDPLFYNFNWEDDEDVSVVS